MAEGNEPQPLGGAIITATTASSKVSIYDQVVQTFGKVVSINIRFKVSASLGESEDFFSGFPRPLGGSNIPIVVQVVNGDNNCNAILTSTGMIRNNYGGLDPANYTINFTYIAV